MKPIEVIERRKADRASHSDAQLLDELRALAPLPDEDDAAWERDETWARAYLLVALSDLVALRRLEAGIGLILDKMCLGDPGEMLRGLRHAFEATVSRDWSRLAEICVGRASSDRAGTRYWAVDELGVLRDPAALPALLRLLDDPERDVALAALRAARTMIGQLPGMRLWFDSRTSRQVVMVTEWPTARPWTSVHFGLLVATDHAFDVPTLAATTVAQGLAMMAAWGPECAEIESAFDAAIVGDGSIAETVDNVILTTSHPNATLEDALETFLDVLFAAPARAETCTTWVIYALGDLAARVERVLEQRGAHRLGP